MELKIDINKLKSTIGVALLVSNDYKGLNKDKVTHLSATHQDADDLEALFNEFTYTVYNKKNITAEQLKVFCDQLTTQKYPKSCKRILIYFSGHGRNGTLLMQDGKEVEIEKLVGCFKMATGNSNETLLEMAKMFFFDACRGSREDGWYSIQGGGEVARPLMKFPTEGNILVAYASTPYHVSYEGGKGGQWTNCLVQALRNSDEREDVCYVLTSASKMLRDKQLREKSKIFQSAEFTTSLTTFVRFKRERVKTPLRDYTKQIEDQNCQLYNGKEFKAPCGIAIGPNNEIFMVDRGNRQVIIFDRDLKPIRTFGQGTGDSKLSNPGGVAVSLSVIAVSDRSDHVVKIFSFLGDYLTKLGSYGSGDGQFNGPEGLCFNSKGLLYVADFGNNRVQVFKKNKFLSKFPFKGSNPVENPQQPNYIAIDSNDRVYVTNGSSHANIYVYGEDGDYISNIICPNTLAICIAPDDFIITSSLNDDTLTVFSPTHEQIKKHGGYGQGKAKFYGIHGIAINSSGIIYVTEYNNKRLQIITR